MASSYVLHVVYILLNRFFDFLYIPGMDVVGDIMHSLSKFPQALPEGSRDFRKLSRPEDKERDDSYDYHLTHSYVEHNSILSFFTKTGA